MIIDRLENIGRYTALNPLFEEAFRFLTSTDLNAVEQGKVVLREKDLWATFDLAAPKAKQAAKLETHNQYIDIQLPLSATERMGYAPRITLREAPYDADKDISFYEEPAENYIDVNPGMFVIFFPEDAHAPAITPIPLKKVIVKVKA
jgi:YhcH/YjgK/YiaL family protein